ncbi:hypothetical protein WR25_19323 [Diploscapter pachys]|uniref:PH domain-containing protein n=1 Tax=Diploscapter pachys TaxID=2018661 RepID=A0A2A2JUX0_9BILA|nr:hypothetical protein WR25_19323 [Diploscapter pachys]
MDCLSSVSGGFSVRQLPSVSTFSSSRELMKEQTIIDEQIKPGNIDDELEIDNVLRSINSPVSVDEVDYLRLRPTASLKDVAEQLLSDQRQAVKDLSLLVENLHPQIRMSISGCKILQELFTSLGDLHKQHSILLEQLEEIIQESPERIFSGLSPLLLLHSHNLPLMYANLIRQYPIYISAYDEMRSMQNAFKCIITQFERTPECYIPVHWLLLKIIDDVPNWQKIVAQMIELLLTEGKSDGELTSMRISLEKISQFAHATEKPRQMLSDYTSLVAIEESVIGTNSLCHPDRKILRVGYVHRWSGQLSPRILILCTDCILFAHRTQKSFVLNANLKLKGLLLDEGDSCHLLGDLAENAITLHSEGKSIVIVTQQHFEWMRDINEAVKAAAKSRILIPAIDIDKSSSEEVSELDSGSVLYVLWHRKVSISGIQLSQSVSYSKSGYLLRKLRNTRGWQKLWVLLTANCMFFYASHDKPTPLASLSLIDYGIGLPRSEDQIRHPCCIRLYYGKHNYFFRANNEFSFESWLLALRKCAINEKSEDL